MPSEGLASKGTTRQAIRENASLNGAYLAMNAFATVIAAYGLLANSVAAVIGAMVVATLLGPITGIALALVDGDSRLLRNALAAETAGIFVVLTISFAIGHMYPRIPFGSEIISRTNPNILDLMIALGGGCAAAFATVSPRISVGLIGVAIATALVPPLAVCGLCLARDEFQPAFGSLLLFLANFVAIQFAYSVVLWIFGYHRLTEHAQDRESVIVGNAISLVLLAVLAVVLGLNLRQSVAKQTFETTTRACVDQGLAAIPGAYLADVRFHYQPDSTVVTAVVRTPFSFTPDQVATIQGTLPKYRRKPSELHVRSVLTKEATSQGYLHEPSRETTIGTSENGFGVRY